MKPTDRRTEQCAAGQTGDADQPTDGKAQARLLASLLGKYGLVSGCVWHRHGGTVYDSNTSSLPVPSLGRGRTDLFPQLAREASDHLLG